MSHPLQIHFILVPKKLICDWFLVFTHSPTCFLISISQCCSEFYLFKKFWKSLLHTHKIPVHELVIQGHFIFLSAFSHQPNRAHPIFGTHNERGRMGRMRLRFGRNQTKKRSPPWLQPQLPMEAIRVASPKHGVIVLQCLILLVQTSSLPLFKERNKRGGKEEWV